MNVNCQTANLIYAITCRHYSIQYVGQTENRLLDRFSGHMFDIKSNDQDTTVARHFRICPEPRTAQLRWDNGPNITILSFIKHPPKSFEGILERNKEERLWMHRLCTITPKGLNLLD